MAMAAGPETVNLQALYGAEGQPGGSLQGTCPMQDDDDEFEMLGLVGEQPASAQN